jgi:ATP-dependent DNA helicase RecQ
MRRMRPGDRPADSRPPRAQKRRGREGRKDGGTGRGVDLGIEPADAPLFEALRAWRRERAAEQKLPPYVIFHDATLAAIARRRPSTAEALAKINGVGQTKIDRYGAEVLRVVAVNAGAEPPLR